MALVQTSLSPSQRDELMDFVRELGAPITLKDVTLMLVTVAVAPDQAKGYVQGARDRRAARLDQA